MSDFVIESGRREDTDRVSLLELPWLLTAAFVVGGLVLLRWIAPATLKGSMAIALAPTFRRLSWAALVGFGLICLAALFRIRAARQKVVDLSEPRREPKFLPKPIVATPSPFPLDEDREKINQGCASAPGDDRWAAVRPAERLVDGRTAPRAVETLGVGRGGRLPDPWMSSGNDSLWCGRRNRHQALPR